VQIYRALLEIGGKPSMQARMTAMGPPATSNASDVIDKLTLFMNRVRSGEHHGAKLSRIVSGAARLWNNPSRDREAGG